MEMKKKGKGPKPPLKVLILQEKRKIMKRDCSAQQPPKHGNFIYYITLHYITLHYITLHYVTLHHITLFIPQ